MRVGDRQQRNMALGSYIFVNYNDAYFKIDVAWIRDDKPGAAKEMISKFNKLL